MRDGDFIVCKGDVRKLRPRRGDGSIHHALRFILQLTNGCVFCSLGSGIRFGLAGERSFLPGKRTGAGLGHLIVNRPCGRTIAAVEVKTVILCVTACGNGLRCSRCHLPAAAVHAAAGPAGRNGNDRAVHLFQRVQLVLVGVDSECQIKASAGSLSGSLPVGIVLLRHGFRLRLRFFTLDGGTDQGNRLPPTGGGLINVGVISRFGGIGLHPVQQFLCRFPVKCSRPAVGVVLHNVQLQIVVNHFAKIRDRRFRLIFRAKNSGKITVLVQRKLVQPAPNANLVAVMVTGDALVCAHRGGVGIAVRRAAVGLTVGAVGAAVGGFAVKPNQPCGVNFCHLGDAPACHRRGGASCVRCNPHIRKRRSCRAAAVNYDIQILGQRITVRGSVDKLRREIPVGQQVQPCGSGRGFRILAVQNGRVLRGFAVIVQQRDIFGQQHIGSGTVRRVFDLRHKWHNGIVGILGQGYGHGFIAAVQGFRVKVAVLLQLTVRPQRQTDFCLPCRNRKSLAADVGPGRCIRQVGVQNRRVRVKGCRLRSFGGCCGIVCKSGQRCAQICERNSTRQQQRQALLYSVFVLHTNFSFCCKRKSPLRVAAGRVTVRERVS